MLELRFDTDEYVVRVLEPDENDIYRYDEATDEIREPDITDYEVYYVENGVVDANGNYVAVADGVRDLELTLQGRTLYVTPDQSDFGLAMASDAVAVVIQPEYNKDNVKTEFTTVKSAISHLADANPATPELEYDGKIFAVLNTNGSAAWIVFDSINGLDTGTGGIIDDNNRNVIHNGNVALWGDNTVVVNGVSISYNYNQSSVAYSFVVPGANIGDVINYNVEARVNGQTVNVKNNVTGVVSQNERGNLVVVGTVNVPATAIDDVDVAVYNAVNQTANTASIVLNSTGAEVTGLATGTANVGDKITFTVKPDTGYQKPVNVTGANVTANEDGSYTLTVVAGVNTVTVEATPIATYTLTLSAPDLYSAASGDSKVAQVYLGDGTGDPLTPVNEPVFGAYDKLVFNIPAGETVTVLDGDITASGLVYIDGVPMTGVTSKSLSFEMPTKNVEIDAADLSATALIAVHYEEGMEITSASEAFDDEENNVFYLSQADKITVTNSDSEKGSKFAVMGAATTTSVAKAYEFGKETDGNVTSERWIRYVSQANATGVDGVTNQYYMVGSTLDIEATSATAVIEGSANFSAKDVTGTYIVPAEDFTLNAAVKGTLNDGIEAKLADGTDVPSGNFVKASTALTITVPTTAGTAAIDLAGTDNKHVAAASGVANNGTLVISNSDIELYAAVMLALNSPATAWYRVDGIQVPVNVSSYVTPGVVVYTDNTNSVTLNGNPVETSTVGGYQYFTITAEGATISVP